MTNLEFPLPLQAQSCPGPSLTALPSPFAPLPKDQPRPARASAAYFFHLTLYHTLDSLLGDCLVVPLPLGTFPGPPPSGPRSAHHTQVYPGHKAMALGWAVPTSALNWGRLHKPHSHPLHPTASLGHTHGRACAAAGPAPAASPCSAFAAPPAARASPPPACPADQWQPSVGTPSGQGHRGL